MSILKTLFALCAITAFVVADGEDEKIEVEGADEGGQTFPEGVSVTVREY